MTSLNHIRATFKDYFSKLSHKIVDSSPLVPRNDPTLMFTNSGMVQFKNVFTGIETRDYDRAVTSQKCVRAGGKHNDLDNVGYTARHHTFFEMLGNFSFGDYFKDEAIPFAWDLLTKEFGLDKNRLLVTVYKDDDHAASVWKKYAGLPDEKIIRIGSSDNFWSMGPTGPCGPCSEIFYDHGPKVWGGPPGSNDEHGDRFIEIWNLVFMQFEQFSNGKRENLPKPSIDTGMGLERIGAVLQGHHDNYETDTMRQIIEAAALATDTEPYGEQNLHHRVIADHLRSSCFLIAEGVLPSNEGRGYVLRRIMRRAMRHIHLLGTDENVMHRMVSVLIQEMGQAFPELVNARLSMEETLLSEERRFKNTLDRGLSLLESELESIADGGTLAGEIAFKLYDTYGFPLDLTQDALRENGYKLDVSGFETSMNKQKEKARAAWTGSGDNLDDSIWFDKISKFGSTEFLGYETLKSQGQIIFILIDDLECQKVEKDQVAQIVFNQTPFYAESGGQVSDIGEIKTDSGSGNVLNVRKKGTLIVHEIKVLDGVIAIGAAADLRVKRVFRSSVCSNHSATHLMHEALRRVLGDHVVQRGSLNDVHRIRFDFSHSKPLTEEELEKVDIEVNGYVRQNSLVSTRLMTEDDAKKIGARALFGEKYGEEVRVVSMGMSKDSGTGADNNTYSLELCGGTHVKRTGQIGFFKIISETASASGVRRIEAVTGNEAINYALQQERTVSAISDFLRVNSSQVLERVSKLIQNKKEIELELANVRKKITMGSEESAGKFVTYLEKSNISFVGRIFKGVDSKELRALLDQQKNRIGSGIVLLIGTSVNSLAIICGVTNDLADRYSAIDLVRKASQETGGRGGGGRPDMAQAGGTEPDKAEKAIEAVKTYIEFKSQQVF